MIHWCHLSAFYRIDNWESIPDAKERKNIGVDTEIILKIVLILIIYPANLLIFGHMVAQKWHLDAVYRSENY